MGMNCDSYGSTGGMGMGGNGEFGSGGAIEAGEMGYDGSSGMGGNQGGAGIGGGYGNSGIGGGYGSSFGNGGSSGSASSMGSRNGLQASPLYRASFDFSRTTQEKTLQDGDKIRMEKRCNIPGLSQDRIRLAVKLDGVT